MFLDLDGTEGIMVSACCAATTTARDFFEMVRESSRDAERCRNQLMQLEAQAQRLSGSSFEPRTRSTPRNDRMESAVVRMVDRENILRRRIESDYAAIDAANRVLYGRDMDGRGGLCALSSVQSDTLDAVYLRDLPWRGVAQAIGFCQRTAQTLRDAGLHNIDEHNLLALAAVAVDA